MDAPNPKPSPQPRWHSAAAVILAALSCWALPAQQPATEAVFVEDGAPRAVRARGPAWERGDGWLEASGTGRLLVAEGALGAGDFTVTAGLVLERIDGTAASLQLGPSSHFGFDARPSQRLFVEGPLFPERRMLAPAAELIEAGEPFEVRAERRDGVLRLQIDGVTVFRDEVGARSVGLVGLRPWRNTMRVMRFAASGNLEELPPNVVENPDFTVVYRSGQGGYHTYRIPAVVTAADGTLLAFCEGRRNGRGDSGDIDLLLRRSTDGGRSWSESQVVWDDDGNCCGNPCPVLDRETGRVLLLATWNRGDDHEGEIVAGTSEDTRRVFVLHSDDHGASWSEPREITEAAKADDWTWYATGPGNGIQLRLGEYAGRLVIPCDHIEAETKRYYSHCIVSDDGGATWRLGESTPRDQVNECAVVEREDGQLLLNMRNYARHVPTRQIARSTDGGITWDDQRHDQELIEPRCQASLIRWYWSEQLADGSERPGALLFSNPASRESRMRMTVRLSRDEGQSWTEQELLHPGPSAYSCLVALPDDGAACLFEAGDAHPYEAIVWRRVTLNRE